MIFINPQWQGSGLTDELKKGADTLAQYFKTDFTAIPLSGKELTTVYNIIGFYPILEQAESFKQIISDSKLEKISTIGGDCGIEIIPISYLNKVYGNDLFIIYIDAHADLNTPATSPSQAFHGMPLRLLLNEGNELIKQKLFSFIQPGQICYVGLRDLDEAEKIFIEENKIISLTTADYEIIELTIKQSKKNKIYIHLDLDVLDPQEFRHSLFPSDNGLKIKDVANIINNLKESFDVVGICVTECTATTLEDLQPIEEILKQVRL
ncbi:arginase family protein [Chitinophaga sp. GbtcB8]|uniref:arginase family protein n=1 Tax=Chitinophaga sp. GbtcB8 TaxID=2824753 RepID=UPI001C2F426E|nr:arginase family protein [Chitinophaga sp. GbtcB8]